MNADSSIITLDGPGGAGKGTLASALARELGWWLLDSGALYRLVALIALRRGFDAGDAGEREQIVAEARVLDLVFEPDDGAGQRVRLAGEDVTDTIRSDAVSAAASQWAAVPAVRDALLERQREFALAPGLIADGRDMGTVVFPGADLKLFVTASAYERAGRRVAQLSATGVDASLSRIYREILERDERDASRATAPLKPAVDAQVIDTSGETVAESLARVHALVRDKGWL